MRMELKTVLGFLGLSLLPAAAFGAQLEPGVYKTDSTEKNYCSQEVLEITHSRRGMESLKVQMCDSSVPPLGPVEFTCYKKVCYGEMPRHSKRYSIEVRGPNTYLFTDRGNHYGEDVRAIFVLDPNAEPEENE